MVQREIVIGDVHGCIEELDALLLLVEFKAGKDRLVFLGDLIDRGPDPVGCVRRAQELGAESIMGNHEEKCVRWHRHEVRRRATGKKNPMQPKPEREKEWLALSEADVQWLSKLPATLQLASNWLAVHAGFEPGVKMEDQKPDRVMRVRWVDPITEQMVPFQDGSLDQPPGTVYWTERWKGLASVVYGHAVHSLTDARIEGEEVKTVGLDTGCCFGGKLTAMLHVPGRDYVQLAQVQAKREYHPRRAC